MWKEKGKERARIIIDGEPEQGEGRDGGSEEEAFNFWGFYAATTGVGGYGGGDGDDGGGKRNGDRPRKGLP